MKPLFAILLLCFSLVGCQKDTSDFKPASAYLDRVQAQLKDSLAEEAWESLDFSKAIVTAVDSADLYIINIPFRNTGGEQFVLLQTDKEGTIRQGRLIALRRDNPEGATNGQAYNGAITIRSLDETLLVQSSIVSGNLTAVHPKRHVHLDDRLTSMPEEEDYNTLPEVVVVGFREPGGGVTYSDWMNVQELFGGSSGGSSEYYSPVHGSGGRSGSKGEALLIDFENQDGNPAIDLVKYLHCFTLVPDAGAACSIEILADIPVDKDPNKLFNWETESPGHTFLQLKKTNGGQTVVQTIGFYPSTNWKTILTPAPVPGKFVDNGGHEFNASLKMDLTPAQLQTALTHIAYLARFIKYDIDEYNCTDFSLEVFNSVRHPANQLQIPKYDIPGGMAPNGTSTPQGLYNQLKSMQQSGSAEAGNISQPGYKGWVANSSGPCN